jgi:hypothetical protein
MVPRVVQLHRQRRHFKTDFFSSTQQDQLALYFPQGQTAGGRRGAPGTNYTSQVTAENMNQLRENQLRVGTT